MELTPRTVQEHARLLAASADDSFASGFDDACADEQMLATEFGDIASDGRFCESTPPRSGAFRRVRRTRSGLIAAKPPAF